MKVKERSYKTKDIINEMNIEDVETIYNTMQNKIAPAFKKIGNASFGSGLTLNLLALGGMVASPAVAILLGSGLIMVELVTLELGRKMEKEKGNIDATESIVEQSFGSRYDDLSFGQKIGLYVNSRKRIKEKGKSLSK